MNCGLRNSHQAIRINRATFDSRSLPTHGCSFSFGAARRDGDPSPSPAFSPPRARRHAAGVNPGWKPCRSSDPDERIKGCTLIIAEIGKESKHNQVAALCEPRRRLSGQGRLRPGDRRLWQCAGASIRSATVVLIARGAAHHAKGDIDAAIADYDKAIAKDKKNAAAFMARASAPADQGRRRKGARRYRRGAEARQEISRPRRPRARRLLPCQRRSRPRHRRLYRGAQARSQIRLGACSDAGASITQRAITTRRSPTSTRR